MVHVKGNYKIQKYLEYNPSQGAGKDIKIHTIGINCNKFYCNLTFYKLNTYLIFTSACLVLWSKNVSTDKNF